jgi:hypothetical protein
MFGPTGILIALTVPALLAIPLLLRAAAAAFGMCVSPGQVVWSSTHLTLPQAFCRANAERCISVAPFATEERP